MAQSTLAAITTSIRSHAPKLIGDDFNVLRDWRYLKPASNFIHRGG
jgi:hypothetical protein